MLFQATGIEKYFGDNPVLSNVSFRIQERDRIGIVGLNGAGKSTLLKIISGEILPDSGEIYRMKGISMGLLSQTGGLESDKTIEEEMRGVFAPLLEMEKELRALEHQMSRILSGGREKEKEEIFGRYDELSRKFKEEGGYEMEAKIRGVLHGLGFAEIPQTTPVQALSGGQKTRLALAKLLLKSPDILLLDEPTNHLDLPALTWLEDYLRSFRGAVVVVSHDRYFLDALVHTIYEVERHACTRYEGNYTRYLELKEAEYERQLKEYERQRREMEKMEDFIRRNIARASTAGRARSRRKALERIVPLEKPAGEPKKAGFSFEIEKTSGNDVLCVRDLSYAYPGRPPLFSGVHFRLKRGEMVALIGPNGTGKSTLLKILSGRIPQVQGEIRWGSNVKIGYYDQEQGDLCPDNTVLDEVWNAYPHLEEVRVRTVLGQFLFSAEDVKKKISALSGGEKARVALAKLMLKKANVLILDEPTNHLDVHSREVLESALFDYEGTVLFVSHDRYFLNKMAERVLELSPEGIREYLGNYDDYLEKKEETERPSAASALKTKGPADYEMSKRIRQEERNKQRKLEQLEKTIMELEEAIASLEEEMALPEVYPDYNAVLKLQKQIDENRRLLEQYYAQWEELASS